MKRRAINCEAEGGISILETAACLVILLPLVMLALSTADYVRRSTLLIELVETAGDGMKDPNFHVGTFVQDYFLHTQPELVLENVTSRLTEYEDEFTRIFPDLDRGKYTIEIGAVMFKIAPQTGRIEGTVNFHGKLPAGCSSPVIDGGAGFEDNGGVIICSRGTLAQTDSLIHSRIVELLGDPSFAGSAELPSLAAHPAALLGTRLQAHFGPSHIFGEPVEAGAGPFPAYVSRFGVSNYLRAGVVYGFAATVDLAGTPAGTMLGAFVADSTIRSVRISVGRAEF